ncbi:MAG: hypothetical protein L3J74_17330, partial [Bacteroidales bacterium]|nr:hypothetical protein [Bacteroidales bacterium]
MSTNRGWTSCMNLVDGAYKHYILNDIKEGTIIAYAVDNEDLNIQRPICRVLIKPYMNLENLDNFILVPSGNVYGTEIDGFYQVVKKWCDEVNNKFMGFDSTTVYCLNQNVYQDNDDEMFYNIKKLTRDNINDIPLNDKLLEIVDPKILAYHDDLYDLYSPEIVVEILSRFKIDDSEILIKFVESFGMDKLSEYIGGYYGIKIDMSKNEWKKFFK